MTANTPEDDILITEKQETTPASRWHIYHLIRLQGEISQLNEKLDRTQDKCDKVLLTCVWTVSIVLAGLALGFNLL